MADLELTAVVPVFNEGANIERTLRELEAAIARAAPAGHETLIVFDFDEDDTLPPVRRLQPEMPSIRLVKNTRGRGALNAIRAGIDAAAGRFVLVTMADGSDDMSALPAMIDAARAGAAVVAASRYMKGGRQIGGPPVKSLLSRAAGLSLHWVAGLPIHDPTNSYKIYSRSFLDSVTIESEGGFELALELSVKAYRADVPLAEVPATWRDRTAGESRFELRRWLPHYLRWYRTGVITGARRLGRRFR
jgi:glycosyltransferase involved in cell wall biosynthesis